MDHTPVPVHAQSLILSWAHGVVRPFSLTDAAHFFAPKFSVRGISDELSKMVEAGLLQEIEFGTFALTEKAGKLLGAYAEDEDILVSAVREMEPEPAPELTDEGKQELTEGSLAMVTLRNEQLDAWWLALTVGEKAEAWIAYQDEIAGFTLRDEKAVV